MNEQIKRLAEKANFLNKDEESIEYFAESLIQACADIADNRPSVLVDKTTGDLIKEHFGVRS